MTPAHVFSCVVWNIFKETLFTEHIWPTVSDYNFIERTTLTFRTNTLRINASEVMVLIKGIL